MMVGRVLATVLVVAFAAPVQAMTLAERQALDLSAWTVRDPDAGYVDLAAVQARLAGDPPETLAAEIDRLRIGKSCADIGAMPVPDGSFLLPSFYESNAQWRALSATFSAFEDAMVGLVASQAVSRDDRPAGCIVDTLAEWAGRNALMGFVYTEDHRQAWYQVESTLGAIALSYGSLRPLVSGREQERAAIESWLTRAARRHLSIRAGQATCCNNHFYRRALFSAAIGVLARDDDLFRIGVSAIYSAVDDASAEGALPLEMARGSRAVHYQNFATMYLVLIAEILERQGYRPYEIRIDGKSLRTIVDFTVRVVGEPEAVRPYTDARQELGFLDDPQYMAWTEIYLARRANPAIEALAAPRRPLYNRTLGGETSLLFLHAPATGG